VGEEGYECELKAAVVCSNPWDLHAGNLALQRTWLGREVYSKTMNQGLKGLFLKYVYRGIMSWDQLTDVQARRRVEEESKNRPRESEEYSIHS